MQLKDGLKITLTRAKFRLVLPFTITLTLIGRDKTYIYFRTHTLSTKWGRLGNFSE